MVDGCCVMDNCSIFGVSLRADGWHEVDLACRSVAVVRRGTPAKDSPCWNPDPLQRAASPKHLCNSILSQESLSQKFQVVGALLSAASAVSNHSRPSRRAPRVSQDCSTCASVQQPEVPAAHTTFDQHAMTLQE